MSAPKLNAYAVSQCRTLARAVVYMRTGNVSRAQDMLDLSYDESDAADFGLAVVPHDVESRVRDMRIALNLLLGAMRVDRGIW
jgi:hypothetical protein